MTGPARPHPLMDAVTSHQFSLQATLSAGSAMTSLAAIVPHHPITCAGDLAFHEDGRFECEHAAVEGDDERTMHCLQASIALLVMELARATY